MKLTNNQIYNYGVALATLFDENFNIYIPVKANFFIQKNKEILVNAAQEIEKTRMDILNHYGEITEDGQSIHVKEENLDVVTQELDTLLSIEQDLNIKTFKIEDLGEVEFTPSQMSAIMFMIDED